MVFLTKNNPLHLLYLTYLQLLYVSYLLYSLYMWFQPWVIQKSKLYKYFASYMMLCFESIWYLFITVYSNTFSLGKLFLPLWQTMPIRYISVFLKRFLESFLIVTAISVYRIQVLMFFWLCFLFCFVLFYPCESTSWSLFVCLIVCFVSVSSSVWITISYLYWKVL